MVSIMTTFCVQNFCKCCLDPAFFGSKAVLKAANFRSVGGDIMRNLASLAATFLIMATAAYSQKSAVSASANEVSQKDEQQIRQLEEEMLKGEMNSDPVVFEKILTDDCLNLPAGPDLTKAKLIEGVRKSQGQAPPYVAREEDMHVYILGDTAVAIYVKEYAVRANPNQVDRQDLTDIFVRSAGTWKLKISRATHQKKES
jgi:uncharacterized protein DUF4440